MIDIKVNGQKLYIPADTSLVLEQNNNSFDIDNIASDIIWTFDIPAKPNAVALGSAHYISVSNYKRYQCEILFNGVVIANGSLYIQSVSNEKTVSCGVVLDGLGDGFGGKKLKENDYGADVVISQTSDSLEQHRANWISFLRGSLSENSIYKFFLFTCEKFYKDNEDYGYHQNKRATLRTDHNEKFWCNYINRLFEGRDILGNYGVGNFADSSEWGIKLFNTLGANTEKLNGFAFAPALRLDWLTRKVFGNAGFSIIGDFLTNENIKKLYIQSMNAMDGDLRQFGLNEYLYITGGAIGTNSVNETDNSLYVGINEQQYNGFQVGSSAPVFNFRLRPDVDSLQHTTPSNTFFQKEDEVLMLFVRPSNWDGTYPKLRSVVNHNASIKDYRYGKLQPSWYRLGYAATQAGYDGFTNSAMAPCTCLVMKDNGHFYGIDSMGHICQDADFFYGLEPNYAFIQLTTSYENTSAVYNDPEQDVDILGNFTANAFFNLVNGSSTSYVVEMVKFSVKAPRHIVYNNDPSQTNMTLGLGQTTDGTGHSASSNVPAPIFIQYAGQLEWLTYLETIDARPIAGTNTLLNVFDIMLRWRQHVPNITNAEYIKKICKFFGLSFYINPFQKEVQLSFVNNVFEAGAIDLSDYVTDTERLTYEPKQYKVSVDTVLGKKGVAEDFMLEDIKANADLSPARSYKKCSVFVKNENAYNHSVLDSKTNKYKWELSAGNDKELIAGNDGDDVEELSTEIAVPNMRVVDTDGTKIYVCDIATGGNSKLMDDDYTGEFEMILQQYKGRRMFHLIQGISYYFEDANPTSMVTNGNVNDDYLDLATVGKNSVGERWLRKFYEFKAHQEKFRFVARLPLSMFMAVYNLQQPQHVAVCDEKRWIMVKNRKYLPTKITYEFGKGDFVLSTIECSRQHYD
jgi:hypothetical protein